MIYSFCCRQCSFEADRNYSDSKLWSVSSATRGVETQVKAQPAEFIIALLFRNALDNHKKL